MNEPNPLPEASADDLPLILVDPSWASDRPAPAVGVIEGLRTDEAAHLVWAEGERERFVRESAAYDPTGPGEPDWARRAEERPAWVDGATLELIAYGPESIAEPIFAAWNGATSDRDEPRLRARLQAVLVRFDTAAAAKLTETLRGNARLGDLFEPVRSLDAARIAAYRFTNLKAAKAVGAAWLDRHGPAAAQLLVPDTLSDLSGRRTSARRALHHLAERHGEAALIDAAATYGPEAAQAIATLLETDAYDLRPEKIRKPGRWLDLAALPQLRLRDKDLAVPSDSIPHVVTLLALPGFDRPTALEILAETCDPASLSEFTWTLFANWLDGGSPKADDWTLTVLRDLGDDATVERLTPLLRAWPGQSLHQRAVVGLGVLADIGTENALRALQGIAEKVKYKALKVEAGRHVARIAHRMGLTDDQLADRLLPDFGFDETSALVLDYGPRRFRVVLDEHLRPQVADEDGKPRKSLPKPGAKDDPDLAGASHRRFADLKKALRTAAADQIRRYEKAMVKGRIWNREEFERSVLGHPLLRHLGSRLVWLAETGSETTGFRIAEDGTFSDAHETAMTLADDAAIRIAHPLHLPPDDRETWGRIFADYEILQPFPQLDRPVMALTAEELSTGLLPRFEGHEVEAGAILGLAARGWVRCRPQDNGTEWGISHPFPGGGHLIVTLSPGIQIGMGAASGPQELTSVHLSNLEEYGGAPSGGHPTDIDPVTASEALAALDRLIRTE
ncbi:DUF4132 domain-containing protein [Glycomyces sp. NRRL B-16210]|uniref:DUF4132 domain-containing protein n=1 Tax=Glycomyces sp. NRRL B-16210 TaxID=1463821 RepID=UPI00068F15C4|nr:DUF4132 domain-containing protein [Glycomyces sp. NRRL B-16210]